MSTYKIARTVALLVLALVVGHAVLLWGRGTVLVLVAPSCGDMGIDSEGRVRRWAGSRSGTLRFLPSDEVDPGGTMPGEDWYQGGWPDLAVNFGSCVPRVGRRFHSIEASKRIELIETTPGVWQAKTGRIPPRMVGGRALIVIGDAEFDELIHAKGRLLAIRDDGRSLLTVALNGDDVVAVRRTPLDQPRVGARTLYGYARKGEVFAGIVGDEYWFIDLDGRFERREPLGVRFQSIFEADTGVDVQAFLAVRGRVRPDRVPLRAIVARPDRPLEFHDVVLEPETPFQAAMDAGIGLLASLRPLPLNCYSATQLGAGSLETMLAHFWEDPYFAQGANLGWLWMTLLVSIACAFVARRWARMRAPDATALWTIAVFLLGPMGLLWMRMTIPWVAIENGRAVNIESADWPAPAHVGTEVFA